MCYHYVYRITNTHYSKHYYGVRTSTNCLPKNDIGYLYFSSSTDKDFIKDQKDNPHNYKYKVIKIFNTREKALALEIELHNKFDVRANKKFYNKAKQTSIGFDTKGRPRTQQEKNNISKGHNKIQSNGKTVSENSALKIAANRIKNGTVNIKKGIKNNNAKIIHIFNKQHESILNVKETLKKLVNIIIYQQVR